jgi:hypothetical protein
MNQAMGWQSMATSILQQERAILAALAMVCLLTLGSGCGPRPARGILDAEEALREKIDPNLPVLTLPPLDLERTVQGVEDERNPEPLGAVIPASDFTVVVLASRAADARGNPPVLTVRIRRRTTAGKLSGIASCVIRPKLQEDGTIRYEGSCRRPVLTGLALLDVKQRERTLLVRAVEVR